MSQEYIMTDNESNAEGGFSHPVSILGLNVSDRFEAVFIVTKRIVQ